MSFNIWERWPWTSFQNLNLDWLMKAMKEAVTTAAEAATTAEEAAESVGQFDQRITTVEHNIQWLRIDLDATSTPARVVVNSALEARYKGSPITGVELKTKMETHGDLPFVEYNREIYTLDSVSNAGDLRFSMGHTSGSMDNDLVIRHIMIPAQSSNCAYSISIIGGGGGSSGNVFAVVVRSQGGGYVADHTYAEILSQMQNGRIPVLLVVQGTNYESCPMARIGSTTYGGQTVDYVEFADTSWMVSESNVIGSWRIYSNGTVSRVAPSNHLATLDNIVDMVNDGVSTNALLKTAQTLTAAEQTQVKQNLGITSGGGGLFVIPVTSTTAGGVTTYSTTATFAEIMAHMPNLIVRYGNLYYTLSYSATSNPNSWYQFVFSAQQPGQNSVLETEWITVVCANNAVTVTAENLDITSGGNRPRVVIAANSSTIPPLSPNTLYVFTGNAAALSITLATPANNNIENEYHFIFNSGSTATTLTLPNTIRQPDGFTVEANHVYEVSILENNMTAQGWAVTP